MRTRKGILYFHFRFCNATLRTVILNTVNYETVANSVSGFFSKGLQPVSLSLLGGILSLPLYTFVVAVAAGTKSRSQATSKELHSGKGTGIALYCSISGRQKCIYTCFPIFV